MHTPITFSSAEWLVLPASFLPWHVYTPAWCPVTLSMVRTLVRLPSLDVLTSIASGVIGWLLNVQNMFKGKSPSEIAQFIDKNWSIWAGLSPSENGTMTGITNELVWENKCTLCENLAQEFAISQQILFTTSFWHTDARVKWEHYSMYISRHFHNNCSWM